MSKANFLFIKNFNWMDHRINDISDFPFINDLIKQTLKIKS